MSFSWKTFLLTIQFSSAPSPIACIASVSLRVRRESWDNSKEKINDGGGGGDLLCRLPPLTEAHFITANSIFISLSLLSTSFTWYLNASVTASTVKAKPWTQFPSGPGHLTSSVSTLGGPSSLKPAMAAVFSSSWQTNSNELKITNYYDKDCITPV